MYDAFLYLIGLVACLSFNNVLLAFALSAMDMRWVGNV